MTSEDTDSSTGVLWITLIMAVCDFRWKPVSGAFDAGSAALGKPVFPPYSRTTALRSAKSVFFMLFQTVCLCFLRVPMKTNLVNKSSCYNSGSVLLLEQVSHIASVLSVSVGGLFWSGSAILGNTVQSQL